MTNVARANEPTDRDERVVLGGGAAAAAEPVYVYGHSDIIYWWVIWAYSLFCGCVTYFLGAPFDISGQKPVMFYAEPWLGVSFVFLMLYVITFTNVHAPGVWGWLTAVVVALVGLIIYVVFGWNWFLNRFPLLFVHMNAGFYFLLSGVLFCIWFFVIVFVDRSVFWKFQPGLVVEKHRVGPDTALDTLGMQVRASPFDIFRHHILGLRWLGLGTGDLVVLIAGAQRREIIIRNVLQTGKKSRRIQALLGG